MEITDANEEIFVDVITDANEEIFVDVIKDI